jgi:DNA-binding HxlR family transcriptional regulator
MNYIVNKSEKIVKLVGNEWFILIMFSCRLNTTTFKRIRNIS